MNFIQQAQLHHLPMAVASSSPCDWVMTHLQRFDLVQYFQYILTAEDVAHVKPEPDLFHLALQKLDLAPTEAVVFEDSPNGITAARSAGIYVIAVPNEITRTMNTSHADLEVDSFLDLDLNQLIKQFDTN